MIKFENVSKKYGENKSVKNSSFEIYENEIVGLIGPNGAGKSTTMKLMLSLAEPTTGNITISGFKADEMPKELKKHIGYLPETPPLYDDMTVYEYLYFVCQLKSIKKDEVTDEIVRVMDCLNISDMRGRLIKNLSKGYKQRVGFAGAIVGSPKILILDEPTVGLDPKQIIDIRNLILELSKDMSIVISSHILWEISEICTRLIIMKNGEIVADGKKEDIIAEHNKEATIEVEFIGSITEVENIFKTLSEKCVIKECGDETVTVTSVSSDDIREKIYDATKKSQLKIIKMNKIVMSLEDIFISLTK